MIRGFGIAAAGLVIAGMTSAAASADDLSSGTWYYTALHVQENLDAGFTGKGVKIAVIDTQINPSISPLQGANLTVVDKSYCYDAQGNPVPPTSTDYTAALHGTRVASLIVGTGEAAPGQVPIRGVAPQAQVLFYSSGVATTATQSLACLDSAGKERGLDAVSEAMNDAMDAHADILSISLGGGYSDAMNRALARALALGIPVVAGLTNDALAATGELPAVANGSVGVQAIDATGAVQKAGGFSNQNLSVKVAAPGVGIIAQGTAESWDAQELDGGTSLATPIVAGFLADMKSKFPSATCNQLLQTMIRNTGGTHHEPQWGSDLGYGTISLTQMREDNPLAYEDVNPFFDPKASQSQGPTVDDVRAAKGAEALKPTAGSQTTTPQTGKPSADGASEGTPTWVPFAIGGGALLLIVVGGVIAVVMSSRRRRGAESAQAVGEPASDGDHFMHAPTGAGSGSDQGGRG
ncbi:S8 family serine peptidase [Microbacterium sp. 13-71-7]|uniref:S8 family peptidase n=1 Tax=Microbacterium sp. 13-71-7 TaxID=1970399 RepID=UPI0025D922AB|nr:S8 family serine peptidase [Microbacterium sp. 13-71-7]